MSKMNIKNIKFIEKLADELSSNNIRYRFIDRRWKKRGDVDIIVSVKSTGLFENILKENGFKRKGKWPPQSRVYKKFLNNETISIGGHIGGYIGGFGGGLGRLGKIFEPKIAVPYKESYLSLEARIFILIYKYGSRKEKEKYKEEYNELINGELDYLKLLKLCSFAFSNPGEIVRRIREKESLEDINAKFRLNQKISLAFRGKPNKILKRMYKIIIPSPYIAFVGCNGTGKSTTIKNLTEKLKRDNLKVATIYSGRIKFQFLPINKIVSLFKPDKITGKKIKKGKKEEYAREVRIFKSPFLNFAAPFVYYAEYIFRYFFKVRPKRIFNDVVLTDRGFIDLFSSPNMNKKVCRFLFRLMPQPKYILLWNDPKIIVKRRPEFLLEQINQQLNAYNQFSNIYLMKVKTDKMDIVDDIAKKIEKMV